MKLTYWIARCTSDSEAYSIRERTKKAAKERLAKAAQTEIEWRTHYGPLHKVTVEYADGFDLLKQCSEEGRGWWESTSEPAEAGTN